MIAFTTQPARRSGGPCRASTTLVLDGVPNAKRSSARSNNSVWSHESEVEGPHHVPKRNDFRDTHKPKCRVGSCRPLDTCSKVKSLALRQGAATTKRGAAVAPSAPCQSTYRRVIQMRPSAYPLIACLGRLPVLLAGIAVLLSSADAASPVQSSLPTCLSSIASSARDHATGGSSPIPAEITSDPRRPMGWIPSASGNGEWISGSLYAFNPPGSSGEVTVCPGNWKRLDCTPEGLAYAFRIFSHEFLHDLCPPHSDKGAPPMQDGVVGPKPSGPAPKPDCNDLNYSMQAAKAICDLIADCAGCLGDCPKEDVCPPLVTAGGIAMEGTETCAKIKELCKALAKEHGNMQDKYNTPANASTAFDCKCGSPPWSPGAGFPACPAMPSPPAGCQGNAQDSYPDNKVVPDCPSPCPQ